MSKSKLFIFFSSFYIFGIFINNFFWNFKTSFIVLLFLVILFLLFFLYTKKFIKVIILSSLGFFIGICISAISVNNISKNLNILNKYSGKSVNIKLEIDSLARTDEKNKVYIGKILRLNSKNLENNKIFTEVYLKINYKLEKGQIIKTKSKVYPYKNTNNFKYKNFMLSKNIYFKIYPYNYEKLNKNKVFFLNNKIIGIKKVFLENINKIYTKNEAIFLGGILFGAREEMPKDLKLKFNNSGLTHLIAVSGFNITILILFFGLIFKPFPKFIKILVINMLIFLFVILVGKNIPVIRAALMGIIGFISINMGRNTNSISLLLFVAIIMLLFFPLSLNYDISFHLSFLAVLGIIFIQPHLDKKLSFITNILEIRTSIVLTISAVLFCLPVMIFGFGQVSIPVILSNILVSWTIPLAMLFGFLSIIVYLFFSFYGIFIGYFAWILLRWDIFIVDLLGSQKWSTIKINFGEFSGYLEFISFLLIIFFIIFFKKKNI